MAAPALEVKDRHEILLSLQQRATEGRELAALDLHLLALSAAGEGNLETATSLLVAAQTWESANGYARAALHTSHKSALTTNFGGNLEKLERYYRETLLTLKKLHNREGLALCLRSVGELALLNSHQAEALKAWELSQRLFVSLTLHEAQQLGIWLTFAREL
jgi:hypothetical protein